MPRKPTHASGRMEVRQVSFTPAQLTAIEDLAEQIAREDGTTPNFSHAARTLINDGLRTRIGQTITHPAITRA